MMVTDTGGLVGETHGSDDGHGITGGAELDRGYRWHV